MKSASIGIYAVAAVALASCAAIPSVPSERPPNVSAETWFPISETLGLVLVSDGSLVGVPEGAVDLINPRSNSRNLKMISPTTGYLMVKTSGKWSRVQLQGSVEGPRNGP